MIRLNALNKRGKQMVIKVKKRDTATVEYDETKIYSAIEKAVKSATKTDDNVPPHLLTIVKDITAKLDNIIKGYERGTLRSTRPP